MAHLGGLGGGGEGGVGGGGVGGDGGGGLHRKHSTESASALTPKQRAVLGGLILPRSQLVCSTLRHTGKPVITLLPLVSWQRKSEKHQTGKQPYLGGLGGGGTGGEGGGGLQTKMSASGHRYLVYCMPHSHRVMSAAFNATKTGVKIDRHDHCCVVSSMCNQTR